MPNAYLNEADTRARLIDPALQRRGWHPHMISREQLPGKVELRVGGPRRSLKRPDYVLKVDHPTTGEPIPVAFVEAKSERWNPTRGIDQVKGYAKLHHVRFVFSTNRRLFIQHDVVLNFTSDPRPMEEFPLPEYLLQQFELDLKADLDTAKTAPFATRYPAGQNIRYYQDAAVRAVFEQLAKGRKRALLSMATGTGKTLVAVNILKRIEEARQLKRALFVCDRDELRNQARAALRQVFGPEVAEATSRDPEKNARVVVATYQLLIVDGAEDDGDDEAKTAAYIKRHYGEDYFSHIIIDECHRSAWNKWSQVLTINPNAVQVGLTATPRTFDYGEESEESRRDLEITRDNIEYFGEPVYEYSMGAGMDDGYLAMMQVVRYNIHIGDQDESERETGVTQSDLMLADVVDPLSGEAAERTEMRDVYGPASLDSKLVMPDRRTAMCKALFDNLAADGKPEQKSIIFCVNVDHAVAVASTLNNLYSEWCAKVNKQPSPDFAFPCTGQIGSDDLATFKGNNNRYFIATTAELLTTGVDIPAVRNIVFFRYIKSPILFQQMLGRGTRIDETTAKLAFTVHDFTNATRLLGEDLAERVRKSRRDIKQSSPLSEKTFEAYGVEVVIRESGNMIAVTNESGATELVSQQEYAKGIGDAARSQLPDITALRNTWQEPQRRRTFVDSLPGGSNAAMAIKDLSGMVECDLYDWLANIGYDEDALTREERTRRFESANADWLSAMPEATKLAMLAIVSQFRRGGTDNLESQDIFDTGEVTAAGGVRALGAYAAGASGAMRELKSRLFSVTRQSASPRLE